MHKLVILIQGCKHYSMVDNPDTVQEALFIHCDNCCGIDKPNIYVTNVQSYEKV